LQNILRTLKHLPAPTPMYRFMSLWLV